MPPSICLTAHPALPLIAAHAATVLMTGAASPMTRASFMSPAFTLALEHSHRPNLPNKRLNCLAPAQADLPGMRINCPMPVQADPSSMRINCQAASQARDLPSRRLNCSSAMSAINPCIAQCTRCHISRLALPLQHLAAALWIRAHYGLGPHSSRSLPTS